MEITDRERIGGPLIAPVVGRTGRASGSYALVPWVRPGDLVVHYESQAEALVGISAAAGPPEPAPIFWAPRGKSARRDQVQPAWKPGLRVPLGEFIPIDPPVTLAQLRNRSADVFAIRDQLRGQAGSRVALFFPWYLNQGRMDTQQSYLVKMPRAVIGLFPILERAAAAARRALADAPPTGAPEVEAAQEDFHESAGSTVQRPPRHSTGQGYAVDQAAKVAVEVRAMNAAIEHYGREWEIEDVHGHESFDLRCLSGRGELHVEVKGTAGAGKSVLLTPNEVEHARAFPRVVLYVLADIEVIRDSDGKATDAVGGRAIIFDPWNIDDGELRPVGFEYDTPAARD